MAMGGGGQVAMFGHLHTDTAVQVGKVANRGVCKCLILLKTAKHDQETPCPPLATLTARVATLAGHLGPLPRRVAPGIFVKKDDNPMSDYTITEHLALAPLAKRGRQ
jgi:hypothetical protein